MGFLKKLSSFPKGPKGTISSAVQQHEDKKDTSLYNFSSREVGKVFCLYTRLKHLLPIV